MRDADCGSDEGSGAGGGRESSGNEEEGEEEKKKKEDSSEKETMKTTTTTTTVTARELAAVPVQEEGPGTSAPKTSDLVTNTLHSEQKKLFSGLSVQLVRAHTAVQRLFSNSRYRHIHTIKAKVVTTMVTNVRTILIASNYAGPSRARRFNHSSNKTRTKTLAWKR